MLPVSLLQQSWLRARFIGARVFHCVQSLSPLFNSSSAMGGRRGLLFSGRQHPRPKLSNLPCPPGFVSQCRTSRKRLLLCLHLPIGAYNAHLYPAFVPLRFLPFYCVFYFISVLLKFSAFLSYSLDRRVTLVFFRGLNLFYQY